MSVYGQAHSVSQTKNLYPLKKKTYFQSVYVFFFPITPSLQNKSNHTFYRRMSTLG